MSNNLSQYIINSIRQVVSPKFSTIELHDPSFCEKEKEYLIHCIKTTLVSSFGEYIEKFETEIASFCKINHFICCVNATAGLHVAQLVLGVKAGDEVLIPAFTFVATANSVFHAGAIPHLVDISPNDFGIDPILLEEHLDTIAELREGVPYNKETGRRISALIVVHCFGYSAQLDEIIRVCKQYNIPVIEDAAEALGSFYKGKHVGLQSDIAVFSFNGNKIITTGGGGAIVTKDPILAHRIRHLITTAKVPHPWEYDHDEIGYNYRLPNINAALGLAQIQKLPAFLERKEQIHNKYKEVFSSSEDLRLHQDNKDTKSNHWLNSIILSEDNAKFRDKILKNAHAENILLRPIWKTLSKLKHIESSPRMDLKNAEKFERRIINIPSSSFLLDA